MSNPPRSPFGLLDRADVRAADRVTIFETADAVVFKIPAPKSIPLIVLSGFLLLLSSLFVLVPISFFIAIPFGPLWIFPIGGMMGALVAIGSTIAVLCWQVFGIEWVRVTHSGIELFRSMKLRTFRHSYAAEGLTDLQTCPDFGFFQRRTAFRCSMRYTCPARYRAVQFRHSGILTGFGQGLSDEAAFQLYAIMLARFPHLRAVE